MKQKKNKMVNDSVGVWEACFDTGVEKRGDVGGFAAENDNLCSLSLL